MGTLKIWYPDDCGEEDGREYDGKFGVRSAVLDFVNDTWTDRDYSTSSEIHVRDWNGKLHKIEHTVVREPSHILSFVEEESDV